MQTLYDAYISSLCLPSHAFFKKNETKEGKLSRLLAKQAFQSNLAESPSNILELIYPNNTYEKDFLTLSPYDIEGILYAKKKGEQKYASLPEEYNPVEEILSKLLSVTLLLNEKTPCFKSFLIKSC